MYFVPKFRYPVSVIARHSLAVCIMAFVAVMIVFRMAWYWFIYLHQASWSEVGIASICLITVAAMFDHCRDNSG